MKNVISKGRHVLGKLSRSCDKRAPRNCEAALTWELRDDGGKLEFSACGEVWNHLKTDIVRGGQCVDDLAALFPRDKLAQRIRETWEAWHLNGMNAGTPAQSACLARAEAEAVAKLRDDPNAPRGCFYDDYPAPGPREKLNFYVAGDYLTGEKGAGHYGWACHVLKAAGLYEVPVTDELRASALGGLPEDATVYRYGSRWLHRDIPAETVALIKRGFRNDETETADPGEAGEPDRDLIAEAGLTVCSRFVPWSQSRNSKDKEPSLNWRVAVYCNGRHVLDADYMKGSAHCPVHANAQFKRAAGKHDMRDAVREECERGKAVKRAFSVGGFIYGDAIMPTLREVLSALLLDASAIDHSFPDWCAEYGYDADSMKARAMYDSCLSYGVALRGAVGPAMFEQLKEGNA